MSSFKHEDVFDEPLSSDRLANMRIPLKNLVYIIGLPYEISKPEVGSDLPLPFFLLCLLSSILRLFSSPSPVPLSFISFPPFPVPSPSSFLSPPPPLIPSSPLL